MCPVRSFWGHSQYVLHCPSPFGPFFAVLMVSLTSFRSFFCLCTMCQAGVAFCDLRKTFLLRHWTKKDDVERKLFLAFYLAPPSFPFCPFQLCLCALFSSSSSLLLFFFPLGLEDEMWRAKGKSCAKEHIFFNHISLRNKLIFVLCSTLVGCAESPALWKAQHRVDCWRSCWLRHSEKGYRGERIRKSKGIIFWWKFLVNNLVMRTFGRGR